jgi:hypothetical protein
MSQFCNFLPANYITLLSSVRHNKGEKLCLLPTGGYKMVANIKAKVPFTTAVIAKCKCPGCPVQAKSACTSGKLEGLTGALTVKPLNRESIPGAYCSTGKASCADLNHSQACACGSCANYSKFGLEKFTPGGHYCRDGSAG